MNGRLVVTEDAIVDALDDLAALGLHWTRNRERGRMPSGIRQAMLLVAREALAHVDAQARSTNQFMDELCGTAAFARHNGAVFVCPEKDHVCGDNAANWCPACPKRSPA